MAAKSYPVELTAPDIEPYRKGNTGIEFVTSFDSGVPGPHVAINAITHGNEICGAIALDALLKQGVRPVKGKLSFAFVNHMVSVTHSAKAAIAISSSKGWLSSPSSTRVMIVASKSCSIVNIAAA